MMWKWYEYDPNNEGTWPEPLEHVLIRVRQPGYGRPQWYEAMPYIQNDNGDESLIFHTSDDVFSEEVTHWALPDVYDVITTRDELFDFIIESGRLPLFENPLVGVMGLLHHTRTIKEAKDALEMCLKTLEEMRDMPGKTDTYYRALWDISDTYSRIEV